MIPEVRGGSDVIRRSDSFIGEPPPVTRTMPDHKRRLSHQCNSIGYCCDSDQLAVIPKVPGGSDAIRRSDSFIGEPTPILSTTKDNKHELRKSKNGH